MDKLIDKPEYRERLLRAIEDFNKGSRRPPENRSATEQDPEQRETCSMDRTNTLWD